MPNMDIRKTFGWERLIELTRCQVLQCNIVMCQERKQVVETNRQMEVSSLPKGEENDKAIGTRMPRFSKRCGVVGALCGK